MELAAPRCVICQRNENLGFNYGVISCGACKMFFHRILSNKKVPKPCRLQERCIAKCRACRFQKCIKNGMLYTPTDNLAKPENQFMLSSLLFNLSFMDSNRNYHLLNSHFTGDYSFYEMARDMKCLKLEPKPVNIRRTPMEWGYISGVISVDFMAKFQFLNNLSVEDRAIIVRKCYLCSSLLSDCWRANQTKKDSMCFPDGTEIIELNSPGITKDFENRIRSQLVGRVNEMRITKEEFLLLSVILICNPALPNLSPTARAILTSYQKIYTSALLQYCLLTYQDNGPARLAELLSLLEVIANTRKDISQYALITHLCQPCTSKKRIFRD